MHDRVCAASHHQGAEEITTLHILALDGRSGAGKSTLASKYVNRTGAQLIHVEDLYPGWEGLAAGADYLVSDVLERLRGGESVVLPRWDWYRSVFTEGDVIEPQGNLVVEGCGAISRGSRPLVDVAVWLEADEEFRRSRSTTRDGADEWWAGWREQENAFYARERSAELADFILAPDVGVDELRALITVRRSS